MFKWTHYAKAMIRAFSGANYFDIDFEISQAILQHYGWRSFYVDLTKSPQIAAWFASNVFEEKKSIHMCEDLDENPVWLVHKTAKYTESSSTGHIYVIDLLALSTLGIKVHDLTLLQGDEGKLRF
ncbi:FRG domain-containing protein, partial [Vibrio anguillarum]